MKTVGVIGFGFMGSRISLAFSIAGFDVHAIDVSSDRLAWGIEYIKTGEYGVKEYVQTGELTEDKIDEVLSRISTSTNIASEIKDADFVVEAVSEKLDLKKRSIQAVR